MVRHRVRLRFEKTGDMRFLGHRDFMRILLRMLRVARIEVAMSQGFHPKPKVSFPSALPLGVEGFNEIVELETAIPYTAVELQDSLNACSVNGLRFHSGEVLPDPGPKGRPVSYTWAFPVPSGKRQEMQRQISRILSGEISYEGKDLRQAILSLQLITRFSPFDASEQGETSAADADGTIQASLGYPYSGNQSGSSSEGQIGVDISCKDTNGGVYGDTDDGNNGEAVRDGDVRGGDDIGDDSVDVNDDDWDGDDKLIPHSFVRFTVKADETPGSVGYKDCLKALGLFPQPLEEGPCEGLTPMLSGARVDCQL